MLETPNTLGWHGFEDSIAVTTPNPRTKQLFLLRFQTKLEALHANLILLKSNGHSLLKSQIIRHFRNELNSQSLIPENKSALLMLETQICFPDANITYAR